MAGASVVLCLWLLSGCEFKAVEPTTTVQRADSVDSYWRPAPVRIRVYPSTQFIKESGRAILEARVELFDEMGDPVKYAGSFRVELYSVDEAMGNAPRRLLYTWDAQVMTLEHQREHYDPITRGYLFRLGVDDLRIAKQASLLRITFTPVDRPRFDAESVIRSDWLSQ